MIILDRVQFGAKDDLPCMVPLPQGSQTVPTGIEPAEQVQPPWPPSVWRQSAPFCELATHVVPGAQYVPATYLTSHQMRTRCVHPKLPCNHQHLHPKAPQHRVRLQGDCTVRHVHGNEYMHGKILTRKPEMCTAPQGILVSAALPETQELHADRAILGVYAYVPRAVQSLPLGRRSPLLLVRTHFPTVLSGRGVKQVVPLAHGAPEPSMSTIVMLIIRCRQRRLAFSQLQVKTRVLLKSVVRHDSSSYYQCRPSQSTTAGSHAVRS